MSRIVSLRSKSVSPSWRGGFGAAAVLAGSATRAVRTNSWPLGVSSGYAAAASFFAASGIAGGVEEAAGGTAGRSTWA